MAKVDLIGKSQQQLSLYRHFGETVAKFQFQLSHFQIRTIGSELFLNSATPAKSQQSQVISEKHLKGPVCELYEGLLAENMIFISLVYFISTEPPRFHSTDKPDTGDISHFVPAIISRTRLIMKVEVRGIQFGQLRQFKSLKTHLLPWLFLDFKLSLV